jgi:hypothetical protein
MAKVTYEKANRSSGDFTLPVIVLALKTPVMERNASTK